jgi:hypothetical protein
LLHIKTKRNNWISLFEKGLVYGCWLATRGVTWSDKEFGIRAYAPAKAVNPSNFNVTKNKKNKYA